MYDMPVIIVFVKPSTSHQLIGYETILQSDSIKYDTARLNEMELNTTKNRVSTQHVRAFLCQFSQDAQTDRKGFHIVLHEFGQI